MTHGDGIAFGADGRLLTELPCVACGYVLRGQPLDGRCPECGATVRHTFHAQRPASWPRPWLLRLRRGLRALAGGVAAGWLAVLVFSILNMASTSFAAPMLDVGRPLRLRGLEWALAPLLLVAFALGLWGTVAITFSGAARVVTGRRPELAWLARTGVIVSGLGFVALCITFATTRGSWRDRMLLGWIALFAGAAVAVWNLCNCLARLARRIPDEPLARRCDSFRWLALATAFFALFEASSFWAVMTWVPTRTPLSWWRTVAVFEAFTLVGRVSLLLSGLVAIQLLRRYSKWVQGLLAASAAG